VADFVTWYNEDHQHSAVRFVTPSQRHDGRDAEILVHRREVYERAKARHPERWTGSTRNWHPIEIVRLNPRNETTNTKTQTQENHAA
jgi:putative transposase